jgi:hypothetical protein
VTSSAKKIARLAEKSKTRSPRGIRLRGGSLFPTVIIVVLALGAALIAYSRQTLEDRTASDITNATYYMSFGVYVCDDWVALPDTAVLSDLAEVQEGAALVSGKPGVVEWQPQVLSGQRRARLSAVLDLYAIEVSDDYITFPASINGGTTLTESTEACDGKGGSLFVDTWDVEGTDPSRKTSIASLGSVRLNNDGLAVALVFAPDGTEVDQPPAASEVALLVNSGE